MSSSPFGVYLIVISGLIGYFLTKLGCEWAPFFLGFVLGPLFEHQLRRTMLISGGDWTVFFTRPISAVLLVVAALILIVIALPMISKKREEVFVEED